MLVGATPPLALRNCHVSVVVSVVVVVLVVVVVVAVVVVFVVVIVFVVVVVVVVVVDVVRVVVFVEHQAEESPRTGISGPPWLPLTCVQLPLAPSSGWSVWLHSGSFWLSLPPSGSL